MFTPTTDKLITDAIEKRVEIVAAKKTMTDAEAARKADPTNAALKEASRKAKDAYKNISDGYDKQCEAIEKAVKKELKV